MIKKAPISPIDFCLLNPFGPSIGGKPPYDIRPLGFKTPIAFSRLPFQLQDVVDFICYLELNDYCGHLSQNRDYIATGGAILIDSTWVLLQRVAMIQKIYDFPPQPEGDVICEDYPADVEAFHARTLRRHLNDLRTWCLEKIEAHERTISSKSTTAKSSRKTKRKKSEAQKKDLSDDSKSSMGNKKRGRVADVIKRAEPYVKKHGFSSLRGMARIFGCAASTILKATNQSKVLRAAFAQSKADRSAAAQRTRDDGRRRSLDDFTLANTPHAGPASVIDGLIDKEESEHPKQIDCFVRQGQEEQKEQVRRQRAVKRMPRNE